jgi:hypothetical protein
MLAPLCRLLPLFCISKNERENDLTLNAHPISSFALSQQPLAVSSVHKLIGGSEPTIHAFVVTH